MTIRMQVGITKKAIIRDEGYPVGIPAPCHIECLCGQSIPANDDRNVCPCGVVYDSRGWIEKPVYREVN